MSTDHGQIRELLTAYEASLNTSDAAAAAALYAPDGEFYPHNLPTAAGADVRAAYEQIFAAIKLDIAFTVHEVVVSGDVAWATTGSAGQVTVLEPGLTAPEANRELFTFARVNDTWKIARYMFNKTSAA